MSAADGESKELYKNPISQTFLKHQLTKWIKCSEAPLAKKLARLTLEH